MTISTTTKSTLITLLNERLAAKPAQPEDNPLAHLDLRALTGGVGVATNRDQHPMLDMTPKSSMGYEMEAGRREGLAEGKADLSAKRMAETRARKARKDAFTELADSPVVPPADRLEQAWLVVVPMQGIIKTICDAKRQWAERQLGHLVDDVPSIVTEQMVLMLAKSDRDLTVLAVAAEELGGERERSGRLPGDQDTKEAKSERKAVAKARKWLMGMVNNRLMQTLVDCYRDQRNLRWDNLDVIDTVMASLNGVGGDPAMSHHKAKSPSSFQGQTFAQPGRISPTLLATAINAAITARGLDLLVEIMLDEDNRRTDRAVKWADLAEHIFLATPNADGAHLWSLVVSATEHHIKPQKARAFAAQSHVRNQFAWLPGAIVSICQAFDQEPVTTDGGQTWQMASDFEAYVHPSLERYTVVPRLIFGSVEDAASALVEHLSFIVTGTDVLTSLVHA